MQTAPSISQSRTDDRTSANLIAPNHEQVAAPNRTPAEAMTMIKFHASLNVSNLARSVQFYSALLGTQPAKFYEDYAKFEIDVPPLILSLKPKRACAGGPLNHLGLRVVSLEHLREIQTRLEAIGARIGQQDDVKCCYARQTKLWITDPDQTLWEVYVLHDDVPDWGEKDKKVKLLAAPFKAFGIRGLIRRTWNNTFRKRAEPLPLNQIGDPDSPAPSKPVGEVIPPDGNSCKVGS